MAKQQINKDQKKAEEAWTPVTFVNSWVNFGSGSQTCAYMKDSLGFVHLKGLMKSGSLSVPAFTLPAGYRPALIARFVTIANGSWAPIDLSNTGTLIVYAGGSGSNTSLSVSLDGITFRAEN